MNIFDVNTARQAFPILEREVNGKPLIYLDNAATTLKPQAVIDAVSNHYAAETANIHRGVHWLSENATTVYESARESLRQLINAPSSDSVILTSGTTASINLLAQSLGRQFDAGDEIIISHMEHHANIVPWQMLCERQGCILKVIPINDAGELDMTAYKALLNKKTKLVAVTWISNALGTVNPVKEIIDLAHNAGALVMLDGAQALSHCQVDVQALDCDFLVFSGHKMFGPTGTGCLYGKQALLEDLAPVNGGGDMIDQVTFEKTSYAGLPNKLEPGTPNIAGVIGLGAAVKFIQSLDFAALHQYESELFSYAEKEMLTIKGLKLIGTAKERCSVLSFVIDAIHPHDLGVFLDQSGVAIRTGHHCAQPVMKRFSVSATARASLSLYNTREEVDGLVAAIEKTKNYF